MADTRSAAGEGSEPRVPGQAQPAHELAKLIAEADAKGKGFWRRLRKPKAGTPSAASAAESADPAEVKPGTAGAQEPVADKSGPATPEPGSDKGEPATPESSSDSKPEATDGGAKSETTDGAAESEATDGGAEMTAAETSGSESAEAGSKSEADAEAKSEGESEGKAVEKSEPVGAEAAAKAEERSGAGAGQESVEGESDKPAEVVAEGNGSADAESADAGSAGEQADGEESAADGSVPDGSVPDGEDEFEDEPRPTVGVVYEPDESPDGFPLEYGDIIIGLPKPAETKKRKTRSGTAEAASPAQPDAEADPEKTEAEAELTAADLELVGADSEDAEAEAELPAADSEDAAAESEDAATEPEDAAAESEQAESSAEVEPEQAEPSTESAEVEPEQAEPSAESAEVEPEKAEPEAARVEAGLEKAEAEAEGTEPVADEAEAEGAVDEPSDDEPVTSDDPQADDESATAAEGAQAAEVTAPAAEADQDPQSESADEAEQDSDSETAGEGEQGADGESVDGAPVVAESGQAADEGAPAAEGEQSVEDAPAADEESAGEASVVPAEPEVDAAAAAEQLATEQAAMALITALMRLRGAVAGSKLPIDVVGADEARQQQKLMLDQLDDYILPRLVQLEAPVLAVVGGSTGAGKSTLVNSLIGQVVSEPGVLRPTTRSPVLIHNPADAEWFAGDRVLPGMVRSSGEEPGGMEDPGQIRLVAADSVPQGLAILDAPDIDSVVEANRELATQLLAAADLWLFVTTAARYADAVPWEFLQSASDRSTAVAVVLDRAPADTIDDITGHLAQVLLERGLGDSPLFSIKETVVDGNGMLPVETVASIKDWLIDLAADAEGRTAVVRRTLHGAVTAMTKRAPAFASAVRAQTDTMVELRSNAEAAYEIAVKDVATATQDGTMLRGEVLARWQEFVGTGELLKGLQTNVGRMRDKVRTAVVGDPPPTRDLNDAIESGLESLLREQAEAGAERAEESWQSMAAGRQLLAAGDKDMGSMSKEFPVVASSAVKDWQAFVLDLVRTEGADKKSAARIMEFGVNGLALALMVVVFASTTEGDAKSAGPAVVGQKLLEAVFGGPAVQALAAKAREDLDGRVHALMDAEFARYLEVLDQHPVDPDAPRQLTEAARAVEDCT